MISDEKFKKLLEHTSTIQKITYDNDCPSGIYLFFKMLLVMNKYNTVLMSPSELGDMFGLSHRAVNKGIRYLKEQDYIRKLGKKEYMINPSIMYTGNAGRDYEYMIQRWVTDASPGVRKPLGGII